MTESETDFIVSRGGSDLIGQQHCNGSRAAGTGCIRTAGFLCGTCICTALYLIFYFLSPAGPFTECEKDGKRLTVKARKTKMNIGN